MEQWECAFCTGLNGTDRAVCWNCAKSWEDTKARKAPTAEELAASAARQAVLKAREHDQVAAAALAAEGTLTFRAALAPYIGSNVSINLSDPIRSDRVLLSSVQSDHFSVERDGVVTRIPYGQILRVSEFEHVLAVEIFHLVVYKGSVGFGMSIPL